jgi:hypothetical protein
MIASKRERKRSLCPVSLRSFGRIGPSVCDHAIMTCDSTESSKINLQAFAASNPETLQSQTQSSTENRISINRLNVFHGRRITGLQDTHGLASKQIARIYEPISIDR